MGIRHSQGQKARWAKHKIMKEYEDSGRAEKSIERMKARAERAARAAAEHRDAVVVTLPPLPDPVAIAAPAAPLHIMSNEEYEARYGDVGPIAPPPFLASPPAMPATTCQACGRSPCLCIPWLK